MIDRLTEYILDEVAIVGEAGLPLEQLASLVQDFVNELPPTTPFAACTIDDSYLDYLLHCLLDSPQLKLILLTPIPPENSDPEEEKEDDDDDEEDNKSSPPPPVTTKRSRAKAGTKKKPAVPVRQPTHEVGPLDDEQQEWSRLDLVLNLGSAVRLWVDQERAWVVVTGSHARPSALTARAYEIFVLVCKAHEEGITVVELGRILGQEQKSLFHFVQTGTQLGIMKKIPSTFGGVATNRVIHSRYLASSPIWAQYLKTESVETLALGSSNDLQEDDDQEDEDEEEEAFKRGSGSDVDIKTSTAGGGGGMKMTSFESSLLHSNPLLVKKRIVQALKGAEGQFLRHTAVARTIGLIDREKYNLRRLNTLIDQVVKEGHAERFEITDRAASKNKGKESRGHEVRYSGLRLVGEGIMDEAQDRLGDEFNCEEDEPVERHCAVATLPIDRQIIDAVAESEIDGTTNTEISAWLGDFNVRTIDHILSRHEKETPPAHLLDYLMNTAQDGKGKVKTVRYFLRTYFLQLSKTHVVGAEKNQMQSLAFTEEQMKLMGGFGVPEGSGETFYKDAREWDRFSAGLVLSTFPGAKAGKYHSGASSPSDADDDDQDEEEEEDEDEDEEDSDSQGGGKGKGKGKAKPKSKKGQPLKKKPSTSSTVKKPRAPRPPRPAKVRDPKLPMTYYEKKKLAILEREKAGLPPLEKRPSSGGGRRSKATLARMAENARRERAGEDLLGEDEVWPVPVPLTTAQLDKVRRKEENAAVLAKSKRKVVKTLDQLAEAEEEEEEGNSEIVASSSKPKKKITAVIKKRSAAELALAEPDQSEEVPVPAQKKKKQRGNPPPPQLSPAASERSEESEGDIPVVAQQDKGKGKAKSKGVKKVVAPPPDSDVDMAAAEEEDEDEVEEEKEEEEEKVVVGRFNMKKINRANDLYSFILAEGGIVELSTHLARDLKEWKLSLHPNEEAHEIDFKNVKLAINALEAGDKVKRYKTLMGTRKVEMIYDSSKSFEEMEAYMAEIIASNPITRTAGAGLGVIKKRATKMHQSHMGPSLNLIDGQPLKDDATLAAERENAEKRIVEGTLAEVRKEFVLKPKVLAAKSGLYYGRYARARALHSWLVGYVQEMDEDKEKFVPSLNPLVFKKELLFKALPLGLFLKLVSVGVDSRELDEFLLVEENHASPLANLPARIRSIINLKHTKRHRDLYTTLVCLMNLNLLTPLQRVSPRSDPTGTLLERAQKLSSRIQFWELTPEAPVYAFRQESPHRLLAVLPVSTPQQASAYWSALHQAAIAERVPTKPALKHPDYPAFFKGGAVMVKQITSKTKWSSEYFLLEPQLRYLRLLLEREEEPVIVDNLTQTRLEQIAYALLAPPSVVHSGLEKIADRLRKQEAKEQSARQMDKRRRKQEDGEDTEGEDEGSDQEREGVAVVAKKFNAGVSPVDKMWQFQLDAFLEQNNHPELDTTILNYLYRAFVQHEDNVDLDQIKYEFRLLAHLPVLPADRHRITIVTDAMRAEAIRANDPYAGPALVQRAKPARRARAGADAAMAMAPPAINIEYTGTQDDFLSVPAQPLPEGRLPANFFTAEQDDLMIDATVILRTRAEYLGDRILWAPITKLFELYPGTAVRAWSARLLRSPEIKAYYDNLVIMWKRVWDEYRGTDELPDPYPTKLVDFDLAPFVHCLRKHINKTAVRLAGAPAEAVPEDANLLASVKAVKARFDIEPLDVATNGPHGVNKYSSYFKIITTSVHRAEEVASLPFTIALDEVVEYIDVDHIKYMTSAALKILLASPKHTFSTEQAQFILEHVPHSAVESAIKSLQESDVIVRYHSEAARRVPGRNYVLSAKWLKAFEAADLTVMRMHDAQKALIRLHDEQQITWPLISAEGDMMMLLQMFSDYRIDLEIEAGDAGEFETGWESHRAVDEDFELGVNVTLDGEQLDVPVAAVDHENPVTILAPKRLRAKFVDMCKRLGPTNGKVAQELYEQLNDAGLEGCPLSDLIPADVDRETYLAVIGVMVSDTVAFWAGYTVPILVSAKFLEHWTISVRAPLTPRQPADPLDVGPPPQRMAADGRPLKSISKKVTVPLLETVLDELETKSKKAKSKSKSKASTSKKMELDEEEDESDAEEAAAEAANMKQVAAEAEEREYMPSVTIFPHVWMDVEGHVVQSVWAKAVLWVQGTLLHHSGLTLQQLFWRAESNRLLTLSELMAVLRALEMGGFIERRSKLLYEGVDDEPLDWELAHWYLSGNWYYAVQ